MTSLLPPIPPSLVQDRAAGAWLREVARRITAAVAVAWSAIDFTTSSLSDITTRPHSALTSILGADNTSTDATQNKHVSNADMKAIQDRVTKAGYLLGTSETGAVSTGTTTVPFDDTIPQITEGDQYLAVTVTPKSASSTLVIRATLVLSPSAGGVMIAALFQDSTANALASVIGHVLANNLIVLTFSHIMTSGTTSGTTFKVRAGLNAANTTTFNGTGSARFLGGVMASSITVEEFNP